MQPFYKTFIISISFTYVCDVYFVV